MSLCRNLVITATDMIATDAKIDAAQADIGNPSARTNFKTVEAMVGVPDAANSCLDDLLRTGFDSSSVTSGSAGSIMEMLKNVQSHTVKVDSASSLGLLGTSNSVGYRIAEVERHFHSTERWWGKTGTATETNAIAANLTPFVAVSGNNAYGAAIPILGTADLPTSSSANTKFDMHRVVISDNDHATPYRMRILYGDTSGSAAAITAGDFTETMFCIKSGTNEVGYAIDVQMPRVAVGKVVWAQIWSATNASEVDFFWACHGYEG